MTTKLAVTEDLTASTNIISKVDAETLKSFLKDLDDVDKVEIDEDDDISIQITDEGGDRINLLLKHFSKDRLILIAPFNVPEGYMQGSLISTVVWNNMKKAHGTFSYIASENTCVLESHLLIKGGVTVNNIQAWVSNFIDKVSLFEESFLSTLKQQGQDSDSGEDLWTNVGKFAGGLIDGWLNTP